MDSILLKHAQLCLDCNAISHTVRASCPACSSRATLPLATALDRKCEDEAQRLPAFETFDERNSDEPNHAL